MSKAGIQVWPSPLQSNSVVKQPGFLVGVVPVPGIGVVVVAVGRVRMVEHVPA